MKWASWNVRGVNEASKAKSIDKWLRDQDICLAGILETRVKGRYSCWVVTFSSGGCGY